MHRDFEVNNNDEYERSIQKRVKPILDDFVSTRHLLEPLEKLLTGASLSFYDFFHDNGIKITKKSWKKPTQEIESILKCKGWVYVFYGDDSIPLYVGETGRSLSSRMKEHSKKQKWWSMWRALKAIPCEDRSSRKLFESILGVSGGYLFNKQQPPFEDDIFFLVSLGLCELEKKIDIKSPLFTDRQNQKTTLPVGSIENHIEYVEFLCEEAKQRHFEHIQALKDYTKTQK